MEQPDTLTCEVTADPGALVPAMFHEPPPGGNKMDDGEELLTAADGKQRLAHGGGR